MQQTPALRDAIAALGNVLTPDVLPEVKKLFLSEQMSLKERIDRSQADIAYGPDERNTLDIYEPLSGSGPLPVFVFVHGGGFVRGDKYSPSDPYNAHMGRWAALNGMIGVVINYRLAPDHVWPAGADDVASVVDWIHSKGAAYGMDPARIVLGGTSAGAAHVADYIHLHPASNRIRAAILLSGPYGVGEMDAQREGLYYGKSPVDDPARYALDALAKTDVPLFVSCAEHDPARFQAEYTALLSRRLKEKGRLPHCYYADGHNHFSATYHIGTSDTRLANALLGFLDACGF